MKPVTFHARFRFKVIHPDHTATMEDLATRTKWYVVWMDKVYPDMAILRKMFQRREDATRYATRFLARWETAKRAQLMRELQAAAQRRFDALPWWSKLKLRTKWWAARHAR